MTYFTLMAITGPCLQTPKWMNCTNNIKKKKQFREEMHTHDFIAINVING